MDSRKDVLEASCEQMDSMRTMLEIIQFESNRQKIITTLLKDPYRVDAVNLRPALNRLPHKIGVEPSELLAFLYVYAPTTISVRVTGTPLCPWHPCGMPYTDYNTSMRGSRFPNCTLLRVVSLTVKGGRSTVRSPCFCLEIRCNQTNTKCMRGHASQ